MGYIGNVTQSFNVSSTMIEDQAIIPDKIANSGDFAFPADIRLKDSDASNYVGFQAPATVSSNLVWTLPSADAAASGYALVSNASGVLSWAAMSGGITIQEEGSSLSTAATTLNFVGSSVTATGSGATKTITITGGGLSSDAQENTVGGTNAGDSFSGTDATDNTLFGFNAGTGITTGDNNTFIGYEAGKAYTSNSDCTGVGYQVMDLGEGDANYAFGRQALRNNSGGQNAAFGRWALKMSSSGTENAAFGNYSLDQSTTGSENTAIGYAAGRNLTSGSKNTFLGNEAGYVVTTGSNNIFVGYHAVYGTFTGSNNILIAYDAEPSSNSVSNEITLGNSSNNKFRIPGCNFILKSTTATDNYVLTVDANGECGWEAAAGGGLSSDAQQNTVAGTNAGDSFTGTDALENSLFGYNAGTAITTADYVTAVGSNAGAAITTGTLNTLFGRESGKAITTGNSNVAVGVGSLKACTTGTSNIAIGVASVRTITTASQNVGIGYSALQNASSGSGNVAIGNNAMWSGSLSGGTNTVVGYYAGTNITSGSDNTIVGGWSGNDITTGGNNVLMGRNAGNTGTNDLTTGSNNILIGHRAAASSATVSNEITFGDANITKFRVPGLDGFQIDDNGTIDLPGSIDENVVTITDASSVALDPDQGTIQQWTLGANRTATDSFTTGQSMMLMIADGSSYTVTWPTMTWVGGSAPTLATSGYTVIELWKTGSTLYGAKVGDVA